MRWLILLLIALNLVAQPKFPVVASWSYPTSGLFQLSGTFGSLLTTSKTASVSVAAGPQTFTVAAVSPAGLLSENNPTQTVTVVGVVLERSSIPNTNFVPLLTNSFVLTNQFTNGFFRSRVFIQ